MVQQLFAINSTSILLYGVLFLISVFVSPLFLMLSLKIFKIAKRDYKTAFFASLISLIISYIITFAIYTPLKSANSISLLFSIITFFSGIIISVFIIRKFYKIGWDKSFFVSLVWMIISGVIMAIISSFSLIFLLAASFS